MKAFVDKLERSKTFWFIVALSFVFFILRLPSIVEPNWYGDEGVYQVVGNAMNHGARLYADVWDNKPPLLYVTYALFHGDHFAIRTFSLFIGLFTLWAFFALSRLLFTSKKSSMIASCLFTLLFATPLLEGNIANAENFILLPVILAAILMIKNTIKTTPKSYPLNPISFFSGFLLGIAFLFKIVAIFDTAAFFLFFIIMLLPERLSLHALKKTFKKYWKTLLVFIVGFLTPVSITILYFSSQNTLPDFFQATFFGNISYVNYGNTFLIPQGFLVAKLIVLISITLLLIVRRKQYTFSELFIFLWLAFSLFSTFFSQRPYTHYLLLIVPAFCLLVGLLIEKKRYQSQIMYCALFISIIVLVVVTFKFSYSNVLKPIQYYHNVYVFIAGEKNITSYQEFFDKKVPRDYEIAAFLKTHAKQNEQIFIWGDNPQIYTLSQTLPSTKYVVAYHALRNEKTIYEVQKTLEEKQPRYIILLQESPKFPFSLNSYSYSLSLDGATIYETSH